MPLIFAPVLHNSSLPKGGLHPGGDSDTLACITGGIAEAFYRAIPAPISDRVRALLPQEFVDILSEMKDRTPYGSI